MTKVGDGLPADRANWKFNGEVVDLFDDHISRSVPLYKEAHDLICDMSDFFIKPDSLCYEVGCSTGTLTLKLAIHNQKKPEARFIGIDIEKDMIKKASGKATKIKGLNVSFIADDVIESNPPAVGCPFQRRCPRRIGDICDTETHLGCQTATIRYAVIFPCRS